MNHYQCQFEKCSLSMDNHKLAWHVIVESELIATVISDLVCGLTSDNPLIISNACSLTSISKLCTALHAALRGFDMLRAWKSRIQCYNLLRCSPQYMLFVEPASCTDTRLRLLMHRRYQIQDSGGSRSGLMLGSALTPQCEHMMI